MIIKKGSYLFSKHHGDQLEHTLLDRSFAFNFRSVESYLMFETAGLKEKGKVTEVTLRKDLLPRHCKLELVEDALASVEMFPNNVQLLKILGDYVENSYLEHRGYFFINCAAWGILIAGIITGMPLILSVPACAFIISSVFFDNYLEKKLGKWMGNFIEGIHPMSDEQEELEETLIALISNCKTAENRGEAAYKEVQWATASPSAPRYSLFSNDPNRTTEHQYLVNNRYDSVREYPRCV